jgi:hypothetical protein
LWFYGHFGGVFWIKRCADVVFFVVKVWWDVWQTWTKTRHFAAFEKQDRFSNFILRQGKRERRLAGVASRRSGWKMR